MLKVTSTGMDAHEDILAIGQVGHSLDVLNVGMGMLHNKHSLCKYITRVHTGTYLYILVRTVIHTSGVSVFPHKIISRTLCRFCRILFAFSKFQPAFSSSPVFWGRFFWRRSRRSIAFCGKSGRSASEIRDSRVAIFQSMHWIRTSTTSLLGSETCGRPRKRDPCFCVINRSVDEPNLVH